MKRNIINLSIILILLYILISCGERNPLKIKLAAELNISIVGTERVDLPDEFSAVVSIWGADLTNKNVPVIVSKDDTVHKILTPIEVVLNKVLNISISARINEVEWTGLAEDIILRENIMTTVVITLVSDEQESVATPSFTPSAGTYSDSLAVTISCETEGAVIYYTNNGDDPTEDTNEYTDPITITTTTTLKARAYKDGLINSSIAVADYVISTVETVVTPSFTPSAGTYSESLDITINCETEGAVIYYTDNGDDPTEEANEYTDSFTINATTTLKARAYKEGLNNSPIAVAEYVITTTETVATPRFTPDGGYYYTDQTVSITCETEVAEIRYTMDGNDPDESSLLYSNPINVSLGTTLKAKAYKTGWIASEVASAYYQFIPSNLVLVEGGTFTPSVNYTVTISTFFISKYEVTQSEYEAIMGNNPSFFGNNPNNPVEQVSWFDVIEYCNRRSIAEGLTPVYSHLEQGTNPDDWDVDWSQYNGYHINISQNRESDGYRLPTEMEWLFAAKGGNYSNDYDYSGSNNIDEVSWYEDNSNDISHPVGSLNPNEIGVYDMSGNVWEWVWDIFDSYPAGEFSNPTGPETGTFRVKKGGAWNAPYNSSELVLRSSSTATTANRGIGFRVCRYIH